jgi:hypothetical protein
MKIVLANQPIPSAIIESLVDWLKMLNLFIRIQWQNQGYLYKGKREWKHLLQKIFNSVNGNGKIEKENTSKNWNENVENRKIVKTDLHVAI